jgi:hypothetical protein
MVGPDDGVKAVEMTLATQPEPAAALRASFTCTSPRVPLRVPPDTLLAIDPRLPASGGALIVRVPPVTVTEAVVVSARAGIAIERLSIPTTAATNRRLVLMVSFFLGC